VIDAAGAIYVIGGSGNPVNFQDVWASTDRGARPDSLRGWSVGYWRYSRGTKGYPRSTKVFCRGYPRGTRGVLRSTRGVPQGYSRGTQGVLLGNYLKAGVLEGQMGY
jgi:hypothetical protein